MIKHENSIGRIDPHAEAAISENLIANTNQHQHCGEDVEVAEVATEGALGRTFLESPVARRSFLGGGAAIVGTALVAGMARTASGQPPAGPRQQMSLVRRHENDHVNFLLVALGSAARPKPVFQNLTAPNLNAFLNLALALENTGVGAYLGATPAIWDRGILSAAGSIALVEARHAGYFNGLRSRGMTMNLFDQELSFERAFTVDEVLAAAGPYIANLNGGPPLTFSMTPSPANDIAILNFALALEYLEAEYYNINVPIFYGV